METFLDFLTENYIYFLIAAGILTLALIGLLVSSKKKGKEESAEVQNVEPVTPVVVSENNTFSEPVVEQPAPMPSVAPVVEPQPNPAETINFNTAEPVVEPVVPMPTVEPIISVPTVEPIQETPATIDNTVQNYDEPIMQIDQTTNNNFQVDQNNNNNI